MIPHDTGRLYDTLALWWLEQMRYSTYGLQALERALTFVSNSQHALDVGCGGEGRFLRMLMQQGFHCTGLDISKEMAALAAQQSPGADVFVGDICSWSLPRRYDVITAWDSTFHLPLNHHELVLQKLCEGLSASGVLLFTCGGGDAANETEGEFGGQRFEYSTLGVPTFLRLLSQHGCSVKHLEYDQYPENHVYIIAQRL